MALYMPAGRTRRRTALIAIGAALVALIVGVFIGRATAPTVDDRIASVRSDARALDGRLNALPLEYEQAQRGDPEFAGGGGVDDALAGILADTTTLTLDTPWLGPEAAAAVVTAVEAARQAAADGVPPTEFATQVTAATTAIDQTFGVPTSGSSP